MKFQELLAPFSKTTRRISIGLGVLKLFRAILSIYSIVLSAKYFGATLDRDSWVLAASIVTILAQVVFGPIHEVFRSKFIHIKIEEGEQQAIKSTLSLFGTIVIVSLSVILVVEVFPGTLSAIFAPGFNEQQRTMLSFMIRLLLPSLLITQLTTIWTSILNAYQSYYVPDILSLVSVVVAILCMLMLAPFIGIYSLVVSLYLGNLALLLVLVKVMHSKKKEFLTFVLPSWQRIKPFVIFAAPFYVAFLVGNLSLTVERMLSTYLGIGNVSVLDYARKFIDMPISVVAGVVVTVLNPTVATMYAEGNQKGAYNESVKFLRMLLLGLAPVVILFTVCSKELVELVLLRGSFKKEYVDVTSQVLYWFGMGTIGYIVFVVAGQLVIAQKNSFRYSAANSVATIFAVATNFIFFSRVGLAIFPITWGGTMLISGMYLFTHKNENIRETFIEVGRLLLIVGVLMFSCYLLRTGVVVTLMSWNLRNATHNLSVIFAVMTFGVPLYYFILKMFRIDELQEFHKIAKNLTAKFM